MPPPEPLDTDIPELYVVDQPLPRADIHFGMGFREMKFREEDLRRGILSRYRSIPNK